jgi:hypothetical protein
MGMLDLSFHFYDFRSDSLPQRRQHSPLAEKSKILEVSGSR